jgi:predicted dehydrogenase
MLGGTSTLKILRNMDYFRLNGGWHGTRRWDGGGVLSNQSIHHIDELAYVFGIPAQVRCNVWTQTHDIECEDLGVAVWKYENGAVVTFMATTSYPHETWYNSLELFGTEGAYLAASGGPFKEPESKWFLNKTWTTTPPEEGKSEWLNNVDNLCAAIRTGAPLVCDGRDGRRTQAILDAMYRSAYDRDGGWTDVRPELA